MLGPCLSHVLTMLISCFEHIHDYNVLEVEENLTNEYEFEMVSDQHIQTQNFI